MYSILTGVFFGLLVWVLIGAFGSFARKVIKFDPKVWENKRLWTCNLVTSLVIVVALVATVFAGAFQRESLIEPPAIVLFMVITLALTYGFIVLMKYLFGVLKHEQAQ